MPEFQVDNKQRTNSELSAMPKTRRWNTSRFDQQDEEPLGPLANLIDVMLVFACGLIAALISMNKSVDHHFDKTSQIIEKGQEIPELPGQGEQGEQGEQGANGYQSVGQVYRDPKTGKLILIGD